MNTTTTIATPTAMPLSALRPKPLNWRAFLAPDNLPNEREWQRAIAASASWFSCACGKLDARIPRATRELSDPEGSPFIPGQPLDGQLATLGRFFALHIRERDRTMARITLADIEAREAEVIWQIEREESR